MASGKKTNRRRSIWEKANGRCAHCGVTIYGVKRQTVDHFIPKSWGGGNDRRNLLPLCKECNMKRKAKDIDPEQFYPYATAWAIRDAIEYRNEWEKSRRNLYGDIYADSEEYGIMAKEREKIDAAREKERLRAQKIKKISLIRDAIKNRHSVRSYKTVPIEDRLIQRLTSLIEQINQVSGLHMQLIYDDPDCFDFILAHYGKFENVSDYIAIVGKKSLDNLDELAGYYGQKLVIAAQTMGLNTCWVGATFSKGKCRAKISDEEKLVCVISIGYGMTEGKKHKNAPVKKLSKTPVKGAPVWYRNGIRAAMMAPTAMNRQGFSISLDGKDAFIETGGGLFANVDVGIVRYNFEVASGHTLNVRKRKKYFKEKFTKRFNQRFLNYRRS